MALRPQHTQTSRFFLNFKNGRCTQQVIGKNKICLTPQKIARYLNLEDPESYTGHSFRRTSATLLADFGADMKSIKPHSGWKSGFVEGYIGDSIKNKRKKSDEITRIVNPNPFTLENDSGPKILSGEKSNIDQEINFGASTSKDSGFAADENKIKKET